MDYHVVEARYVDGFRLWIRFRDGRAGVVDLAEELVGPVFESIKEPDAFKRFRIDPEFHTLVWPNGADLAPELLYDRVKRVA